MNELVAYLKSLGAEHIYVEEDLRKGLFENFFQITKSYFLFM
jgi:hypothetical protein